MSDALPILPLLPDYFRPRDGDPIPEGLVGSRVVGVGTFANAGTVEGGGLIIDYHVDGERGPRRVVLAFTELGMWVDRQHSRTSPDAAQGSPA